MSLPSNHDVGQDGAVTQESGTPASGTQASGGTPRGGGSQDVGGSPDDAGTTTQEHGPQIGKGWRARMRSTRAGALTLKAVVFVIGGLFVALGVALAALPGPLTIPPVLLGVWIWSSEFRWAERLLDRVQRSAQKAWAQAKRRPVSSAFITVGGLIAAGVVIWAVGHYELVDKAKSAVGL